MHDLRQPLGNIALSASYLDVLLGDKDSRVRAQLRAIQQELERASDLLSSAPARLGRIGSQGAGGAAPIEATKSTTAGVT
jgi:hypothetical protein